MKLYNRQGHIRIQSKIRLASYIWENSGLLFLQDKHIISTHRNKALITYVNTRKILYMFHAFQYSSNFNGWISMGKNTKLCIKLLSRHTTVAARHRGIKGWYQRIVTAPIKSKPHLWLPLLSAWAIISYPLTGVLIFTNDDFILITWIKITRGEWGANCLPCMVLSPHDFQYDYWIIFMNKRIILLFDNIKCFIIIKVSSQIMLGCTYCIETYVHRGTKGLFAVHANSLLN